MLPIPWPHRHRSFPLVYGLWSMPLWPSAASCPSSSFTVRVQSQPSSAQDLLPDVSPMGSAAQRLFHADLVLMHISNAAPLSFNVSFEISSQSGGLAKAC